MSAITPPDRVWQPPRFVQKLFSPVASRILRSPVHGLLSRRVLLITFTGRVSGRVFTTPVLYEQEGETLRLRVSGAWWRNLRGGASVRVLLRGQTCTGTTEAFPEVGGLVPVTVHLTR